MDNLYNSGLIEGSSVGQSVAPVLYGAASNEAQDRDHEPETMSSERRVSTAKARLGFGYIAKVARSNRAPRTSFYRGPVGLAECPYLTRWVLELGWFGSIRLHRWAASDDYRAFHDHTWWFVTIVLWGSYFDVSPAGIDWVRAGQIRFRRALHRHTVQVPYAGTWTLLFTGRSTRRFGFYTDDGKFIHRDKYFAQQGHHPCDPAEPPVRFRPMDRSRIKDEATP